MHHKPHWHVVTDPEVRLAKAEDQSDLKFFLSHAHAAHFDFSFSTDRYQSRLVGLLICKMFYGQYSWLDKSDKSKHLRVFPVSLVLHSVLSCVFFNHKISHFQPSRG